MQTAHATILFSDFWETYKPEKSETTEYTTVTYAILGIDEVRQMTAEAHRRPTVGDDKVLLVRTATITLEAQQALLKTLEEPPTSTSICLVVPIGASLLPTILSRVQTLVDTTHGDTTIFATWLALPYRERLEQVERAAKDKNQTFFVAIQQGLRVYLSENHTILTPTILSTAHYTLTHLRTRGASNKMLLESLALTLPVS